MPDPAGPEVPASKARAPPAPEVSSGPPRVESAKIGFPARMVLMLLLTLLVAEFLLGMGTNLYYADLPSSEGAIFTGSGPQDYPALIAHIANGYVIGLLALLLVVVLYRRGAKQLTIFGVLGVVGVSVAGVGGSEFLESGGIAVYSLLMAIGFLWSFAMFFYIESKTRP